MIFQRFLLYQILASFHILKEIECGNFFITKAYPVGGENDPSKFHFYNITTKGENQYLNMNLTISEVLDNKVGGIWVLEYAPTGNKYVKIRTLKEKYACRAFNAYGGVMWHDIEKSAGINPGACPIPPGNYAARNHFLDFSKLTIPSLPVGKLRFTIILFRHADQSEFLGSLLELTQS